MIAQFFESLEDYRDHLQAQAEVCPTDVDADMVRLLEVEIEAQDAQLMEPVPTLGRNSLSIFNL
jgi:hypothetical protein